MLEDTRNEMDVNDISKSSSMQTHAKPGDWVILRTVTEDETVRPVLDRRPQRPWFPTRDAAIAAVSLRPDTVWIAQIEKVDKYSWTVGAVEGPFGLRGGDACST